MPTQNRSTRGKNVTESADIKSSQGRAQSWWRPSRAREAKVESRWHEKVARKRKNNNNQHHKNSLNEEQQQTSKKPPGGSPKQSTIAGSFC